MADWGSSSNRSNIFTFYCLVFTFTSSQLFQSTTCCSSFVSATSEGVLGGLADPRATLRVYPWRDPARSTFGGLPSESPGDRSDRSTSPVWSGVDAETPRQLPLRAVGSKRCQHQPTILFAQNKPGTSQQYFQNKSTPATSYQCKTAKIIHKSDKDQSMKF
jgi:hypothetical protein